MIRLPYVTFGRRIHREIHDDLCLFEVVVVDVVGVTAADNKNNNNNNNNNHDNNDSFHDTSTCTVQ